MRSDDGSEPQHYKTVYETRTFLSFHVREAALQALLPPGWSIASNPIGADAGANLRFGLSDQFAAVSPNGAPVEVTRFCPITVPTRRTSDAASQLHRIAIGYWSNARAREPMRQSEVAAILQEGNIRPPDRVEIESEIRTESTGATMGRQRWLFSSPQAQEIAAEFVWTRGDLVRDTEQFWVMSPAIGQSFRRYQIEKVEDVVFSVPLGIDRRRSMSYRTAGPMLAGLFDGSEKLVSVVVQTFGRREIYLY